MILMPTFTLEKKFHILSNIDRLYDYDLLVDSSLRMSIILLFSPLPSEVIHIARKEPCQMGLLTIEQY